MYNGLFSSINNISSYWLGYIAADGNICKNKFSFNQKNEEILRQFLDDCGFIEKRVHHYFTKQLYKNETKIHDIWSINIGDKEFVKDLLNLGIVPRKSRKLDSNIIPSKYQLDFIRGVFDGDGSVGLYKQGNRALKKTVFVIYGHKPFLIAIKNALNYYNVDLKIHVNRMETKVYSLSTSNRTKFNKIKDLLYNNAERFLKRKEVIFNKCYNYNLSVNDLINNNKIKRLKYDKYIEQSGYRRSLKQHICKICSKQFLCRTDQSGDYCSRQCSNSRYKKHKYYINGRAATKIICNSCGKEKIIRNDIYKKYKGFCRLKCKNNYILRGKT